MIGDMVPYVVSLAAHSPMFTYLPYRESDADVGWNASYTGSSVWPIIGPNRTDFHKDAAPAGTAYRRTRVAQASVSLTFEGTGAYMCFSNGGGDYTITLDGLLLNASAASPAIGSPCEKLNANTTFATDDLTYGNHTTVLTVTSAPPKDSDFRFLGGGVTLGLATNGFAVDDTTVIDDQDVGWHFVPPRTPGVRWDTHVVPGLFNTTVTFNCIYDHQYTATYTFNESLGVILTGEKRGPEEHTFSIAFDDEVHNLDSTSHWGDGDTIYFAKGNLDPTISHVLTIVNWNADKPDCTSIDEFGHNVDRFCCVSFDSLTLLKASPRGDTELHIADFNGHSQRPGQYGFRD
ncbi:hypothetical protein EXIGLDRAFT_777580 [Exidia glandulosa HHB12029]|uniref:Uncharacterized protein n=1 Tax=Exidia glandulosa HHB12029 TaxID=1314781 RepID=A0A165CY59_EXIGL|nr:hypothetical protein EXIGLDRAFT_777580 [Exidia glandulosa HHB12029]